jgi:Flp pilus assembly pilin Flp
VAGYFDSEKELGLWRAAMVSSGIFRNCSNDMGGRMMQTSVIRGLFSSWCGDRRGSSAAEYALIIAGIGAFVVAGATIFGGAVQTIFEADGDALAAEVDTSFK